MRIFMTGASRSLGQHVYEALQVDGHQVYGVGLGGPDWEIDLLKIKHRDAGRLLDEAALVLDGYPQTLINSAGITSMQYIEHHDPEADWAKVIQLDLTVPYWFAQHFVKHYARGEGDRTGVPRVVNIASMAHRLAMRTSTAYNVAKAGLVMLTKQMAKECLGRSGVLHFAVSPNSVGGTTMAEQAIQSLMDLRGMTREAAEKYNAQAPAGRPCTKAEVYECIRWCIEQAPEYCTGINLELPGGMA